MKRSPRRDFLKSTPAASLTPATRIFETKERFGCGK